LRNRESPRHNGKLKGDWLQGEKIKKRKKYELDGAKKGRVKSVPPSSCNVERKQPPYRPKERGITGKGTIPEGEKKRNLFGKNQISPVAAKKREPRRGKEEKEGRLADRPDPLSRTDINLYGIASARTCKATPKKEARLSAPEETEGRGCLKAALGGEWPNCRIRIGFLRGGGKMQL